MKGNWKCVKCDSINVEAICGFIRVNDVQTTDFADCLSLIEPKDESKCWCLDCDDNTTLYFDEQ